MCILLKCRVWRRAVVVQPRWRHPPSDGANDRASASGITPLQQKGLAHGKERDFAHACCSGRQERAGLGEVMALTKASKNEMRTPLLLTSSWAVTRIIVWSVGQNGMNTWPGPELSAVPDLSRSFYGCTLVDSHPCPSSLCRFQKLGHAISRGARSSDTV